MGGTGLAHRACHSLTRLEGDVLGLERGDEHEHVVDADADQDEGEHVDHRVELEADARREAVREADREADLRGDGGSARR